MTNSLDQLKSKISQRGGLARPNRFMVELPTFGSVGMEEMNILCRSAALPGKQVLTSDRRIGMELEKIAYGYAVGDVTLNFLVLKDYSIKKYFDSWVGMTINEDAHTAKYKKEYQRKVVIHQLEEEAPSFHVGTNVKFPIPWKIGKLEGNIPLNIKAGKNIKIPPIPGTMMRNSVYSIELVDAFPTTIGGIEFNNDADGIIEFSVQFSYTNWRRARPSAFSFDSGPIGGILGNIGINHKFRDMIPGSWDPMRDVSKLGNNFGVGIDTNIDIF